MKTVELYQNVVMAIAKSFLLTVVCGFATILLILTLPIVSIKAVQRFLDKLNDILEYIIEL